MSPEVIRGRARQHHDHRLAGASSWSFPDKRLLVDTGDGALDAELAGYWRVVVGPMDEMVMKVVAA